MSSAYDSPPPLPPQRKRSRLSVQRIFTILYNWAESGWSGPAVGAWGVLQSALVPGPSDALLAPLGIADQKRVPILAVWTTVGAIVGGLIAYAIGALAFHLVGDFVLGVLDVPAEDMSSFGASFAKQGWWVIVVGALPFMSSKLIAYAAGAVGYPLGMFFFVWCMVRVLRSLIVGTLLYFGGPRIQAWVQNTSTPVA